MLPVPTKTFAEETGAKVYYHTGVFTGVKTGVMVGAGGLALTALVLVVLAQLNVLSIPPQGMYALYIAGGAVAAGDLIALVVLSIQHQRAKAPLEEYLKHNETAFKFDAEDAYFKLNNYEKVRVSTNDNSNLYYLYAVNKGQREFHLFSTRELIDNFAEDLKKNHDSIDDTVAEITGAKIYYHTGAFTWPKVAALSGAGAIAVALSVIAILALLKVGPLGSLSSYGVYGLITAGAIVTADLIAIAVIDIRAKAPLKKYIQEEDTDFWSKFFKYLNNNEYDYAHDDTDDDKYHFVCVINNGQSEIHLCLSEEQKDTVITALKNKEIDYNNSAFKNANK